MNKKVRVTIKAAAFSVNHNDGLHVELYIHRVVSMNNLLCDSE
jgi:hypothetical protein